MSEIWNKRPKFTDYGSVMWEEHGQETDVWLESEVKPALLQLDAAKDWFKKNENKIYIYISNEARHELREILGIPP